MHAAHQTTDASTEKDGKLNAQWMQHIGQEFDQPYMHALKEFLKQQKAAGKTVYPKGNEIFNALNTTPFDNVKVVILGQDPYHGPNQAHGLSFSVRKGVPKPPSLMNIYKELEDEYGTKMPNTGDLTGWAEQGVLLLNATLTVEQAMAGSHQNKGWENFTDAVIKALNDQKQHLVFMLWGSYAHKKGAFIDKSKHLVLQSAHPSPLSAHRGFLGNGHFKAANGYLEENGVEAIKWDALN